MAGLSAQRTAPPSIWLRCAFHAYSDTHAPECQTCFPTGNILRPHVAVCQRSQASCLRILSPSGSGKAMEGRGSHRIPRRRSDTSVTEDKKTLIGRDFPPAGWDDDGRDPCAGSE